MRYIAWRVTVNNLYRDIHRVWVTANLPDGRRAVLLRRLDKLGYSQVKSAAAYKPEGLPALFIRVQSYPRTAEGVRSN